MAHGFRRIGVQRRQDVLRTLRLQPSGQSSTNVRAPLRVTAQLITDNPGAVLARHKSSKSQKFTVHLGKTAQGHLAASSQSPAHGAFSLNALSGNCMMQWLHELDQIQSAGKAFDSQRPLTDCRQAQLRTQQSADTMAQPQPFQSGSCQDYCVKLTLIQLAQSGLHVATQRLYFEGRKPGAQLAFPP